MQLEDRFYTSTEVAEILGVSLRSIYRYLDEKRLDAEIKTATGRHRFTKKNIMDFLYPIDGKTKVAPVVEVEEEVVVSVPEKAEELEMKEEINLPAQAGVGEKKEEIGIEDDESVDWLL